jgi:hypothetical protein
MHPCLPLFYGDSSIDKEAKPSPLAAIAPSLDPQAFNVPPPVTQKGHRLHRFKHRNMQPNR